MIKEGVLFGTMFKKIVEEFTKEEPKILGETEALKGALTKTKTLKEDIVKAVGEIEKGITEPKTFIIPQIKTNYINIGKIKASILEKMKNINGLFDIEGVIDSIKYLSGESKEIPKYLKKNYTYYSEPVYSDKFIKQLKKQFDRQTNIFYPNATLKNIHTKGLDKKTLTGSLFNTTLEFLVRDAENIDDNLLIAHIYREGNEIDPYMLGKLVKQTAVHPDSALEIITSQEAKKVKNFVDILKITTESIGGNAETIDSLTNLNKVIEDNEKLIGASKDELKLIQDSKDKLGDELIKISEENKLKIEKLNSESLKLQDELKTKTDEFNITKKNLEEQTKEGNMALSEMKNKITMKENEFKISEKKISELEKNIVDKNKLILKISDELDKNTAKALELQKEIDLKKAEITVTTTKSERLLKKLESDKESFEKISEKNKVDIENAKNDILKKEKEISEANDKLIEKSKNIDILKNELQDITTENEEKIKLLKEDFENKKGVFNKDISDLTDNLNKIKKESADEIDKLKLTQQGNIDELTKKYGIELDVVNKLVKEVQDREKTTNQILKQKAADFLLWLQQIGRDNKDWLSGFGIVGGPSVGIAFIVIKEVSDYYREKLLSKDEIVKRVSRNTGINKKDLESIYDKIKKKIDEENKKDKVKNN